MFSGTMREVKIVHISDVHVKSAYYSEELASNVIDYISNLEPDVLVITGDLTDNGYPHEYDDAVDFVNQLKARVKVVVPGNHDARNMGYVLFEELFKTRFPMVDLGWLKIQGVDSSEPDLDDGHIGRLAYGLVEESLIGFKGIKIVALHHHLVPIPGTGRERNIPVDSGDFLALLCKVGVHLILSGHKHVPWIWELNSMLIVNAGTATTLRVKAHNPPSFNIITLNTEGEVVIERVESETLKSTQIYKGIVKGAKIVSLG